MRKLSSQIAVGNTYIGGNSPITVQSMLSTPSYDIDACVNQAIELEAAGCNIIRTAIPDMDSIRLIPILKEKLDIPIVADIHFNHKLAIEAVAAGVDKIRINPGNIGNKEKIKSVANACNQKNIPIRIGVNSGSLEEKILEKYKGPSPEAMCESALYNASLLENFDFTNIIISMKSPDVLNTVKAYKEIRKRCTYPLHIGITEAGTEKIGIIKSAAGIGALLIEGIGDTIRFSLTANPLKEVEAGINLLKALGMRNNGVSFVSCPTCGRTRIDIIKIAKEAEQRLKDCKKNIKVAIMGCVVNGPGEARDADIGITGANGEGVIFKRGKVIRKVKEHDLVEELVKEVSKM